MASKAARTMSDTAIVLVARHGAFALNRCLNALIHNTENYHLYVVLPAGTPTKVAATAVEFRRSYPKLMSIVRSEDLHADYVSAVNSVFSEVQAYQYVCLLESNIQVTTDWLPPLVKEIAEGQAAQVGPATNAFLPPRIRHRILNKAPLANRWLPWAWLTNQSLPETPGFHPTTTSFDYLPTYCSVFPTDHIQRRGYILDPALPYNFWDDLDLSLYLRQFGKIGVCNDSYVNRIPGISPRIDLSKMEQARIKVCNTLHVMHKWEKYIQSQLGAMSVSQRRIVAQSDVIHGYLDYLVYKENSPDGSSFSQLQAPKIIDQLRDEHD